MNNKFVMLAMAASIILIFVSVYFIYLGITSQEYAMTVVGVFLLIVGSLRAILFIKNFHKNEN